MSFKSNEAKSKHIRTNTNLKISKQWKKSTNTLRAHKERSQFTRSATICISQTTRIRSIWISYKSADLLARKRTEAENIRKKAHTHTHQRTQNIIREEKRSTRGGGRPWAGVINQYTKLLLREWAVIDRRNSGPQEPRHWYINTGVTPATRWAADGGRPGWMVTTEDKGRAQRDTKRRTRHVYAPGRDAHVLDRRGWAGL